MSLDLITLTEASLIKRSNPIQFVPSLSVLSDAFAGLVPCRLCSVDMQEIIIEITRENKGHAGIHETYERVIAAPIRFHKFRENDRDIWLYYGPVKQH